MNHQLAQLNIARFRLPQADPVNADFVNNLDRINGLAESHSGFVWRLIDTTGSEDVFGDPNVIVNLSVWQDAESLRDFAYKNAEHTALLKRRKEWFDETAFYLVLWWVPEGHTPDMQEAHQRLQQLTSEGPSSNAFTFRTLFDPQ